MTVLERSELDASPLADLHAIADQIGLDGFRRLRKADLIDAILERSGGAGADGGVGADGGAVAKRAGERATGDRAGEHATDDRAGEHDLGVSADGSPGEHAGDEQEADEERDRSRTVRRRRPTRPRRAKTSAEDREQTAERRATKEEPAAGKTRAERPIKDRSAEGVVELLGNGSAFLRVSPPEASDEDAYISAAQVRRCELVSGDRVSGPVRTPRQSERYPSLARVDTINGAPADSVAEGTRYEDLAVAYPAERLELDPQDPTLGAIEWLTPIGRGSRASIVGEARAGKTETLRRLLGALAGREGLEVMLVLSGVRPEEIAVWREGPVAPAAALDLGASAELQAQTVEHVVDTAKRVAARGGHVVVLIDTLDCLPSHAARRILAGARNLAEGGSLTLIATATRPLGGESTVIALDVALTSTGRIPALDLAASGVVRPELLVGEDGAAAITKARASALDGR
jgi:transcription termination factor Rho